jgi:hypothetical protein
MINITGKVSKLFVLMAIFILSFNSCATTSSSVIAASEIPSESVEPTPFEGIWSGVQSAVSYTYQFKGNTFLAKLKRTDMDKPTFWQKGVFVYTEKTISLIHMAGIDPNVALVQDQPYGWISSVGLARNGGTFSTVANYTLSADGLTLGKTLYRNVTSSLQRMDGPEDIVYFFNQNNWASNNTENPYAFSIEKIDDVELVKVSNFLGKGYQNAAEDREPGIHKITFRQTRREGNRNNEVYGYFTRDFLPGLYRFSVFTENYAVFMPSDLPPIAENHVRVVIMRTEFGKGEILYDYIDVSL